MKPDRKKFYKEISPYRGGKTTEKYCDARAECIKSTYKRRIKQLQESLLSFPDRIFRNVHVSHSRTEKTCPSSYLNQELTYPQIENPSDENEKSWNNVISEKVNDQFKGFEKCQDIYDKYTVSFSNKHLISVKHTNYWYIQDAPDSHGYLAMESINRLLEGKRELQAKDLFDDKTDWCNKIAALAAQKGNNPSELTSIIASPSDWEITKNWLGFLPDSPYNSHYGDQPLFTIDWKTIDPYLSKNGRSLLSD